MAKQRRRTRKPKRGRPESDDPMTYRVMVRMTESMGAKLATRAKSVGTTESALARQFVEFGVDHLAMIVGNVGD